MNKRTRLLWQAGFPEPDANVVDVRYDDDRKLDRSLIMELFNCGWIRNRRNVLFAGASGSGKTWISNALVVAACNAFSPEKCIFFEGQRYYFIGCTARQNGIGL